MWNGQQNIAPPNHIVVLFRTPCTELSASVNTLTAAASQRILCKYLNKSYVNINELQFAINCVLGFGHHNNIFTSTTQINYRSPSGGHPQKELSFFEALNVDLSNDPACYTCFLFRSHLLDNTFPSCFCLLQQRKYCELLPFTAFTF